MRGGKLKAWYQASRPPFFVATLIPLGLGAVVAHTEGPWSTARWVMLLFAAFLVHLATNLGNDYFDYAFGADTGESLGGSRVLQQGKLTAAEIRDAMILCYVGACLVGLWIVWTTEVWWLLALMLVAFLSSLFYTAPPIRYGYLGLGELFVGLNMGPVMVVGTAAALTGQFVPRALWLSVPVGLMVAMILYYQSLSDIEEDRAVGKLTIAARLGQPRAIWGVRFFFAASLAAIALLVAAGLLHPAALISLGTGAIAYRIDAMIERTSNWKELHDRGGPVRLFYLANGLIIVLTVAHFG
jgi:1,4-dihydroxy-2-naphthoate octaprenyltransferase